MLNISSAPAGLRPSNSLRSGGCAHWPCGQAGGRAYEQPGPRSTARIIIELPGGRCPLDSPEGVRGRPQNQNPGRVWQPLRRVPGSAAARLDVVSARRSRGFGSGSHPRCTEVWGAAGFQTERQDKFEESGGHRPPGNSIIEIQPKESFRAHPPRHKDTVSREQDGLLLEPLEPQNF